MTFLDFNAIIAADIIAACYMRKEQFYMPKVPYNKRSDGRYYKQVVIGRDANGKRKVKTFATCYD